MAQIIDRKGKHAVQPGDAVRPPLLPRRQNDLAIAVSMKLRAAAAQLFTQLAVIVDLAVEHQHRAAIGGGHRLRRPGEIDDREPQMTQPDPRRSPHPLPVRAPVGHRVAHPLKPRRVNRLGRGQVKDSGNSAHAEALSGVRRSGPSTDRDRQLHFRTWPLQRPDHARRALRRRGSATASGAHEAASGRQCW